MGSAIALRLVAVLCLLRLRAACMLQQGLCLARLTASVLWVPRRLRGRGQHTRDVGDEGFGPLELCFSGIERPGRLT